MSALLTHILTTPAWLALLVVFALPALESSMFVGFVFPGETALVLGGVLASQGHVPLAAVIAAGVLGAGLGDSAGYLVGRRYGQRLLRGRLGRRVNGSRLAAAQDHLARRGAATVFLGRFTATLRVLVPGLAGMAGMPYRRFVTANLAGAVTWGPMSVLLGYAAGASWQHATHLASGIGLGALLLLVAVLGGGHLWRRRRTGRRPAAEDAVAIRPTSPTAPAPATACAGPHRPSRPLVVVPTYDEAENIAELLDRLRRTCPQAHVLVVDDGSPDGTAGIVAAQPDYGERVWLLQRSAKEGLGEAYRAGFRWALHCHYDAVVQMDADLSHPVDRLPALLAALGDHDVAVGSRYVAGGATENWPAGRRLISWAGNTYVRLVLALGVRDSTSGYKAFRIGALTAVGVRDSTSNGYCFQIENTWRAVRRGLRVAEVPITFTDRTAGASKMSRAIVAEALWRVLLWRGRDLAERLGLPPLGRRVTASPRRPSHVA